MEVTLPLMPGGQAGLTAAAEQNETGRGGAGWAGVLRVRKVALNQKVR